ncbi:hypothetical protein [uncultured Vagococcus sp.]|uniref:alpha/beta hydrolase n=1 Tax=uncultured Vagococcus sp. TaxID=189676 RepID=UPI0028D879E6|nr:hypothetical protein [uncultured Vagococcus sp.]
MRVTDIVLIFWQILMLGLLPHSIANKRIRISFTLITSSLLLLHLVLENYHWQMIPTYLSLLLTFWLIIRPTAISANLTLLKKISLIFITIVMIVPVTLFPVVQFDSPTGSFIVGKRSISFTHLETQDLSFDHLPQRQLKLQIYYPATAKTSQMASYLPNSNDFPSAFGTRVFPNFLFSHYKLIHTNAYTDAPYYEGTSQFPLLIFSGGGQQNTFQLVEMASHGFIIIEIDHTRKSQTSGKNHLFPVASQGKLTPSSCLDKRVSRWEAEIKFVLDSLSSNKLASITSIADRHRIGVMGYSEGGTAATQALIHDSRLKAGINLDGPILDNQQGVDFSKPYLLLNASSTSTGPSKPINVTNWLNGEDSLAITIPNSNHLSFTDLGAASFLLNQPGADPFELYRDINRYSLNFFTKHLQNVIVFDNKRPVIAFSE